jgi:hypothetical protein
MAHGLLRVGVLARPALQPAGGEDRDFDNPFLNNSTRAILHAQLLELHPSEVSILAMQPRHSDSVSVH